MPNTLSRAHRHALKPFLWFENSGSRSRPPLSIDTPLNLPRKNRSMTRPNIFLFLFFHWFDFYKKINDFHQEWKQKQKLRKIFLIFLKKGIPIRKWRGGFRRGFAIFWVRILKFSAYAWFVIPWSPSKFELI